MMFLLEADKVRLRVLGTEEPVTSGSRKIYSCKFQFSQDWEGLDKTVVFRSGSISRSTVLDPQDYCQIPWEVLEKPSFKLECGVCGTNGGEIVIPTVFARLGAIVPGVGTAPKTASPPRDVYAEILHIAKEAEKTANSVREDADAGKFSGGSGIDVTGARIGQTVKILAVDETGRPTAWEPGDLPQKLPSPGKLTFTGGITGEYDGSENKQITIPAKTEIDASLSVGGKAADAKIVGDKLAEIQADPAYFITTYTDNGDGTASGDHTFEEAGKAFQEGKILMANVDGVLLPMVYMDTEIREYAATIAFEGIFTSYDIQHTADNFAAFLSSETTLPEVDAELSDTSENPIQNKAVSQGINDAINGFAELVQPKSIYVTFTGYGSNAAADATYEQIMEAASWGANVYAGMDDYILPLAYVDDNSVNFFLVVAAGEAFVTLMAQITSDGAVSTERIYTMIPPEITVAQTITASTTNPVQGKTIKAFVEGKGYQTEAQVTTLINNALGVIENGAY